MNSTPYESLLAELVEIAHLGATLGLLHWDQQTHLPPAGTETRARQVAQLSAMIHQRSTSKQLGEWIEAALPQVKDEREAANLREIKREYERDIRVPVELVAEISRVCALAEHAWAEARKASDFPAFAPHLKRIIELKRQQADALGHNGNRYDALLDRYEPGETTASIAPVLNALRQPLADLIARIGSSPRKAPRHLLAQSVSQTVQQQFALEVAKAMGYDLNAGRLDVSTHPFCTGLAPGDVRITTRYNEKEYGESLFGVMHEVGHALYEQGLPADRFGQPLGWACSLGIHESQSRLWENAVGRSEAFWRHWLKPLCQATGVSASTWNHGDFCFAINHVAPSFIRTESDEATYNLHIILRFELEQKLLSGALEVDDLPAAWNAGMKELLGVDVPDDRRGCLQDIHWSGGAIGYFPTYTLGNLHGAQLFEAASRDLGSLDGDIARGQMGDLLAWLREKIHRYGRQFTAGELIHRATGSPPSSRPLLEHLRRKAERWYGV